MNTPTTDTDLRPGSLRQRARSPSAAELEMIPWLGLLEAADRQRVIAALRVVEASPGDFVCKIGRQANYWFGVLDGLLKMSNDSSLGFAITFTGVPPGAWFGEGTVLKREVYRYNIEPLRRSVVAGIDIDTFFWLLERSIPFNRYVMNQLNERLGQFIGLLESERLLDTDARVARCLATLFNPVLYPGLGRQLQVSQEEIGYLTGVSRQRVNRSLKVLQFAGYLTVEYGSITIRDLDGLRRFGG